MTVGNILSAFRSEKELVQQVFARWQMDVFQLATRTIVPFEIAYSVAEESAMRFRLLYTGQPLWVTSWQLQVNEPFEELTAAEMLVRFGLDAIEDTLERGVSKVRDKILGGAIQVINAGRINDLGVIVGLRTEYRFSLVHKYVKSAGNDSWWKVTSKPGVTLPEKALKLESQHQQGIVHYLLQPITGREEPKPGEILFW